MKKLLTLFTLLLTVCSGAWGDTESISWSITTNTLTITPTITPSTDAKLSNASTSISLQGFSQTSSQKDGYCKPFYGTNVAFDASDNYAYISFKVADGYTFTPSSLGMTVYSHGTGSLKYKVIISDSKTTPTSVTSNEIQPSSGGESAITFADGAFTGKAFEGTVTIKLYAYNYANTSSGKRTYIKSPITISGTVSSATTYKVTYKANGGEGEDFVDNSATTILDVNDCSFTAPSGKAFAGWKDSEETSYAVGATVTSDLTLFAQWVEGSATTITYNLKTNSSSTTLDNCTSATPNSGSIIASTVINTYGTANCDGSNSAKENETQKLKIDGEYTAGNYYEWTFTEDNCTFAPTSVQIKFQSVSGLVQYKVALTDGITTKTTNFVQTTSAGNTLETLDWKITDGTVFAANQTIKLQLWAYKKDNNAAAFRLGSPITINGIVMTIPSTVSGTITASRWNTFSCNYALDLSTLSATNEVKAYYASAASDGKVTMSSTDAIVPAGTGLMINGTAGETFTINTTSADATPVGDNLLVGLPNGGIVPVAGEGFNYVFGWTDPEEPGFYLIATDKPTLGANKAYLHTTTALSGKLNIIIDDSTSQEEETDGIKAVSTKVENGVRYNLAGQKVGADYNGIVIVNGKKMLNK